MYTFNMEDDLVLFLSVLLVLILLCHSHLKWEDNGAELL